MNLVYDCEIIKMIPVRGSPIQKLDGLEYCGGWEDFENMGISVICTADLDSDNYHIFLHPDSSEIVSQIWTPLLNATIYDFEDFVQSSTMYGFNSRKFDDNLCQANGINLKTDFDLLEQVRLSAYGSIEWYNCPKGCTYKLDALAQANGLGGKTGSGELAPKLWQQGKQKEVIDYCMNDVRLTKELILKFKAGKLIDPNTGLILHPVNVK